MAVCQNLVPLVRIKIAGKWMFIPLKMVLIGIDPYPYVTCWTSFWGCNKTIGCHMLPPLPGTRMDEAPDSAESACFESGLVP